VKGASVVDLNEAAVFARVVQDGSFTKAAQSLGIPKSTVSRRVAELEARVGVRLLQRTTRKLALTDSGRLYYEHAARALAELELAERAVGELQAVPRGTLRITTPLAFSLLGPLLAEYLRRYPEVRVDLYASDRRVDLVEERFDLALRAGPARDSSLVARRLGVVRRVLVAAPEVARKLRLKTPEDLERENCLVFAPDGKNWTLTTGAKAVSVTVTPRMTVNDYDMLCSVTRAGFGVALLPEYQCTADVASGALRRLLPQWSAPEVPVYALYPSARHLSPSVAALLELLRTELGLPRA
jgi:DNA-binding transcriptional LysR family regulator